MALAEHHFGPGPEYCAGCRHLAGRDCDVCPYRTEAPATEESAAAWQAFCACIRSGVAGGEPDIAATLALAVALGCPPATAAILITHLVAGFSRGLASRKE